MLDKLPAWLRHLLICILVTPLSAAVALTASAVVSAHGLTGIDWTGTFTYAENAAANLAAGGLLGWLALWVTPITTQYGVGAPTTTPVDTNVSTPAPVSVPPAPDETAVG